MSYWHGSSKRSTEGGLYFNLTRHRASTSKYSLTFRVRVVAIATQPVHRLQIRPIVHSYGHSLSLPKLHPGPCNSVGMRPPTDMLTHRHTDARDHNTFGVVYDSRQMQSTNPRVSYWHGSSNRSTQGKERKGRVFI